MLAFRLCLELGVEHPDYLLERLTANQLTEWMGYFQLVNESRKKQETKPNEPGKIVLKDKSPEDQKQGMLDLARSMGAKIVERKK